MIEETKRIYIDYLQVEIEKMQKTARGLEQMINEKDSEKDVDLIKNLKDMRSTTLDSIENKKRELQQIYNKSVSCEDN